MFEMNTHTQTHIVWKRRPIGQSHTTLRHSMECSERQLLLVLGCCSVCGSGTHDNCSGDVYVCEVATILDSLHKMVGWLWAWERLSGLRRCVERGNAVGIHRLLSSGCQREVARHPHILQSCVRSPSSAGCVKWHQPPRQQQVESWSRNGTHTGSDDTVHEHRCCLPLAHTHTHT